MGIYATVNDILVPRLEINSAYKNPCKTMTFSYPYLIRDIGDTVTGKIIWSGGEHTIFYGNVKAVTRRRPESVYEYSCQDVMARAVEYYFTPENALDNAYTAHNISHIALAQAILSKATLTNFQNDWPAYNKYTQENTATFQFATGEKDVEIKIAAAWDVLSWICEITGSHIYADTTGKVHLGLIWDEVAPSGETIYGVFATGASGNMKSVEYTRSDENLRNKVVVYGTNSIVASAQASSPWVVDPTFYKTAIISYEFIDTQSMADVTASVNLHRMNKLTESCIIETLGDPSIDTRQVVTITDSKCGLSGNWFVTQCKHSVSKSGYTIRMTGTR
jgi:hypothetical protein